MSPSTQLPSEYLKESVDDDKMTDQWAWAVQEPVDGKEVLEPGNTSSEFSTGFYRLNNTCQHEYPDEAVRQLNAYPIPQPINECVYVNKYSFPCLSVSNIVVRQIWAIWNIVKR